MHPWPTLSASPWSRCTGASLYTERAACTRVKCAHTERAACTRVKCALNWSRAPLLVDPPSRPWDLSCSVAALPLYNFNRP